PPARNKLWRTGSLAPYHACNVCPAPCARLAEGPAMPRFAVILPAAGKSSRFTDKDKKVFANLDGRPVWLRAAELFANRNDVCQCVVVIAPEDQETFQRRFGAHLGLFSAQVALGGAERFDSVANALRVLKPDVEFVAVHDAARPCLPPNLVDDVFGVAA